MARWLAIRVGPGDRGLTLTGAGRPLDGGRGRTWACRWSRRVVIGGDCRTDRRRTVLGAATAMVRCVVLWRGRARDDPRRRPPRSEGWSAGSRSARWSANVVRADGTAGIRSRSDRSRGVPGHDARTPREDIATVDDTDATGVRLAEPAAQRLPALLHDGESRCDPDPGSPPVEGAHPAGHEHVALPAPRRRPHGAGLRQRRLPHPTLQPVRLLRGRTDPGVTYEEALRALSERGRFGIRLGLGRTRALLRELGHPEHTVRGALIAGTNGKGSVLAIAEAGLRAAGYHVGTTPKPHLVTYRERVQVDGRPISADDFARLVETVLPIADRVARRHGDPTEFELLTAVVFARFAEVRPDVALIEVGLGGRLDATHAWDGGVAVVTNVDLDHMAQLGDTIPKIAREKAAIIERGDVAVTGARGDAIAVVRRRARRMGVPLTEVGPATLVGWDRDGIDVDLPRLGPTRVGLRGRHQAANAAVADATLDALEAAGIATVPDEARRRGYGQAVWPGRLELIAAGGREILLDGAHNPAGAAALASSLDDLKPFLAPGPITLVTASMADKDVAGVVAALAQSTALAGCTVICTSLHVTRALPAADLAALWRATGVPRTVVVESDPLDAVAAALVAESSGTILIAGSLYLVGAARGHLVDDPDLRDPDADAEPVR